MTIFRFFRVPADRPYPVLRALRPAILVMLMAGISGNAAAAKVWVVVGKNEKFSAYASPASMRKDGNMVKMWDLFDYKTAQTTETGKRFVSSKRHIEYDCKQMRARPFAVSSHTESMGQGQLVEARDLSPKWNAVATGSADELLWKFACGK